MILQLYLLSLVPKVVIELIILFLSLTNFHPAVSIDTLTTASVLYCSIMRHREIAEICKKLSEIDSFMEEHFKLQHNQAHLDKSLRRKFLLLWFSLSFGPVWACYRYFKFSSVWHENILNHIIDMQLTQIVLVFNAVQHRMKMTSEVFVALENPEPADYKTTQTILLMLCDLNRMILNHFKIPMMLTLMQIYANIVICLYWIEKLISGFDGVGEMEGKFET